MPGISKDSDSALSTDEGKFGSFGHSTSQLRDEMRFTSEPQFTARVRIVLVAGNPGNEFDHLITLKNTLAGAVLSARRLKKGSPAKDARRKQSGPRAWYSVNDCIKITPWEEVKATGNMAIQFEKADEVDVESFEVRQARQAGRLGKSRSAKRTARTKFVVVSIRGWSLESISAVRHIWDVLDEASSQKQSMNDTYKPRISSDRVTLRNTVIDEKTRMRERRRYSEDRRLLPSISPSSTGRLSQGQKAVSAMSSNKKATTGRYSALSRGATGRKSYSSSLIGAPNLSDFGKKPPRGSLAHSSAAKKSTFDAQLMKMDQNSDRACDTQAVKTNSLSTSPKTPIQKRQRGTATSAEVNAKRQRYLSEQLKSHKLLSQPPPSNRTLRSSLHSLPTSSALSNPYKASGIFNEGNTCYLAATVQALLCDQDLIARLRKRTQLDGRSAPFSAALKQLYDDRDSSKTLNAGLIRQAISKHFSQFSSSDQQDAHEFFLRCLDVLSKEFATGEFHESPTHANYSLVQEQHFTCTSCGHQTKPRREIARGLSLDIPGQTESGSDVVEVVEQSLQDLIDRYFAPQHLVLNCETCDGRSAKSNTKIVLLPRVLVLHIKRFGLDYDSDTGAVSIKKISDPVNIPKNISVQSVLARGASSLPNILSERTEHGSFKKSALHQSSLVPVQEIVPSLEQVSKPDFPSPSCAMTRMPLSPSKYQCSSPITQVLPSPKKDASRGASTPNPFNLARRFRVHAKPSPNNAMTDLSTNITNTGKFVCDLDATGFDGVQDDIVVSQAEQPPGPQTGLEHHVKAITSLGFPLAEAQKMLRETSHDITRAMGLAMDKKRQEREASKDLNEYLLDCVAEVQGNNNSAGNKPSTKYSLAAVIRHHSDTTDKGHYVADVLQSDGSWLCYDDASVFKMTSTEAQAREGYLCWYIAE